MITSRSSFLLLLAGAGSVFLLVQSILFYGMGTSFFVASLCGIIALIPYAYLSQRLAMRPLRQIVAMARRVLSEDVPSPLRSVSADSVENLARLIDEMANRLTNKTEELVRLKATFQTILSGMANGVLVVDGRGRILLANEALKSLLSLSSSVANCTPLEVVRNADLEEAIQRILRDGGREVLELYLPTLGEKTLEVNLMGLPSSLPFFEQRDRPVGGVIAVFHDITRLKRLERVRQDFVANVSHELKTPLTTIKGYVETLLEGGVQQEVAFPFLQVIRKHTDRLEKILEDLLILSKVETKTFSPRYEVVSLGEVIEHAVDLVKESAERKSISIFYGDVSPTLSVQGEQRYLEQVFVNLLDNAIKYGREGGNIQILAKEIVPDQIQISVEDNGIGIPREDLPRIFERFYRVDKGRSKELGGTGLGLSIVKHIVQAHGGTVWAESQFGKGSIFYVTLPRVRR